MVTDVVHVTIDSSGFATLIKLWWCYVVCTAIFGVWLGEDQEHIILAHVFKSIKYSIHPHINSEHNWEDLFIHLRNQQTRTSINPNYIIRRWIFNPIFVDASS